MSLTLHSLSALFVIGTFLLNLFLLQKAHNLKKFKRLMSIVLIPLSITILGLTIFTGTIMMAAKHLDFTIENIVMIIISIIFIILEVKRAKYLKYLPSKVENAIDIYRSFGSKVLYIELGLVVAISVWMWLV